MTLYIVFASYKGGVGRSFAAVSTANALVRYGLRVVLVDLDVDAPSLPALYDRPVFGPYVDPSTGAPPCGLVPWVAGDNPDLADNLIDLDPSRPGALRLLQAGPVDDGYLQVLLSSKWREDVELHPENFAQQLRAAFEGLPDPPDVVIIDGRAGLVPTTGGLVQHLADRVAFLFAGDAESVHVANDLIAKRGREVVLPVLSRFPHFVDIKRERLEENLDRLVGGPPDIFLNAAPGHEGSATPTIGLEAVEATSPLTLDHFRLSQALVPRLLELPPSSSSAGARLALTGPAGSQVDRDLLDVWERAQHTLTADYKLFRIVAEGRMFNEDFQRNVAFKVETISKILDQIVGSIRRRKVDPTLRRAGRTAGEAFGRALVADFDAAEDDIEQHERLALWARFDSSTGFGGFSISRMSAGEEPALLRLDIVDPFLNESNRGAALMEGYVEGVLEVIIGTSALEFEWSKNPSILSCPIPGVVAPPNDQ